MVANIFNEYKMSRVNNLHKFHEIEYIDLLPEDGSSKQIDVLPELEDYSAMTDILGAALLWFVSN